MALQKLIVVKTKTAVTIYGGRVLESYEGDRTFPAAYFRVEAVNATKTSQSATVAVYAQNGGQHLYSQQFDSLAVTDDGGNNIAQAYGQLKLLPEFAGAVDC